MRRQILLSAVALGAIIGCARSAAAQDAASPTVIEELVVTAEKREQSLQDIPLAVSAYTSERRDVLGVNTVEDLARVTPSMSYTNNDRMSIRGLGRLTNSIGTDPSVALYSDGIFTNSMFDASTPSLFIERTEVLRGPQGTLYGRNSVGGAMNIISKRPTTDYTGEVRLTAGNYDYGRADAMVSGPIAPGLRFLLGGSMEVRDKGFIKNIGPGGDAADSKRYLIEAQIEADLGEHTTARLRYTKFDWDDGYGVGNTLANGISPLDTTSLTGVGTSALYYNTAYAYTGTNPAVRNPYRIDQNASPYGSLDDHHRVHLDVTSDLGWAKLKYLAGYQQYDYNTSTDSDRTPRRGPQNITLPDLDGPGPLTPFTALNVSTDARTFYREKQSWLSNELNLSSESDGPFNWIVGLYQYYQEYDQPQGIRVVGDPSIFNPIGLTGAPSAPNPRGAFLFVNGHLETNSYAAFAQTDWKFAPHWTLTTGIRYTYDKKTGTDSARYVARSPAITAALAAAGIPATVGQGLAVDITALQVCGGATITSCAATAATADLRPDPAGGLMRDLSGDWDAVTGTVALQWEPDPDTHLYARYSRGYKSGGWIGSNGLSPDPFADPEYVNSYEIGAKKNIGRRFQANIAGYYTDYNGFQAPLTAPLGTITATQFLNLDATIWGVEVEAQWVPIDQLNLGVSYAYLNTELDSGCCFVDTTDPLAKQPGAKPAGTLGGFVTQSVEGDWLPISPRNKVTAYATYTWDLSRGTLTATGSYTYTGKTQTTIFANPTYTSPSFQTADFRLMWRGEAKKYTIIGFVKNAFDETGYTSSTGTPPSAAGVQRTVTLIFPRTYGVELQYQF